MKRPILLLIVPLLALMACSHIDDDERMIYVKPASVMRTVLIEDFTGQRCVNCPKATEMITQLEESYPGGVIAVGIHSGPFARSITGTPYALATPEGDEYYNHWNLDHQPVGMVNRMGVSDYTDWNSRVHSLVELTAPLSISVKATLADGIITIDTDMQATDGNIDGKLQLWLLEDGIVAFQYLPDGSVDRNYVHNHVLRGAINGTWGEALALREGDTRSTQHTHTLDAEWNADNLRVVAFVYNDDGVMQVAQCHVETNNVPELAE